MPFRTEKIEYIITVTLGTKILGFRDVDNQRGALGGWVYWGGFRPCGIWDQIPNQGWNPSLHDQGSPDHNSFKRQLLHAPLWLLEFYLDFCNTSSNKELITSQSHQFHL